MKTSKLVKVLLSLVVISISSLAYGSLNLNPSLDRRAEPDFDDRLNRRAEPDFDDRLNRRAEPDFDDRLNRRAEPDFDDRCQ